VVSSELLVPNSGDFIGKRDQLKKMGPQNGSDMDIPLNDSKPEALPYHFGVEPLVPLLAKEDEECLSYSSLQTYNLKKQPSYGSKSNMYWFDVFMRKGHV
jgi:hypothetical protein